MLAVVAAMIVGGILMAATNDQVRTTSAYFFARPGDMLARSGTRCTAGTRRCSAVPCSFPVSPTSVRRSAPHEHPRVRGSADRGGLGVALAFRVGLFNIGGRGQILIACAFAGLVTFNLDLPMIIQLPLTLIVGIAVVRSGVGSWVF